MKKLLIILIFVLLAFSVSAQSNTHMVIDSAGKYVFSLDDVVGFTLDWNNTNFVQVYLRNDSAPMYILFKNEQEAIVFIKQMAERLQGLKFSSGGTSK